MTRPSMFDFAGGEEAMLALAAALHRRCLEDPELNHPFSHSKPDHVARLAAHFTESLGGPPRFSQRFGGHSAMLEIHAGEGPMDDLGRRFVACFVQAADDIGLPEDPEFRAGLRGYMERAVEEVLSYGPPGSTVAAGLPVPRWGWDRPE